MSLVYVGHLAVAVALHAPILSLLSLTSPSALLGPAMAVGAPGAEAPVEDHDMRVMTWRHGDCDHDNLTWFYPHRSSDTPDTGCIGYTSPGRSDTGGTWQE